MIGSRQLWPWVFLCLIAPLPRPAAEEADDAVDGVRTRAAFAAAPGFDWPQFRGPDRSGVSRETGLARRWPAGGPPVLWRRPLGEGFSGIAVAGGLLYTQYSLGEDEVASAFRAADGTEVWRMRLAGKFHDEWGNGPRATPTVDGDTVYVLAAKGPLAALDAATGAVRWQIDLERDYPLPRPPLRAAMVLPPDDAVDASELGYSSSPLVEGELLIVYTGAGNGRSLVALDKRTGEERWSALDGALGYSSPAVVDVGGRRQIVLVTPEGIAAVDAVTGRELWQHPWRAPLATSQPVFVAPDKVFASASLDVGGLLLTVTRDGRDLAVEERWHNRMMRTTWSSPVALGEQIYGFDNATLRCLSAADGTLLWARRGLSQGSLIVADGLIFVLNDRGLLLLLEATAEQYRERGRAQVLTSPTWTSPSLSRGRLFLRNHDEMISLDLRAAAVAAVDGAPGPETAK